MQDGAQCADVQLASNSSGNTAVYCSAFARKTFFKSLNADGLHSPSAVHGYEGLATTDLQGVESVKMTTKQRLQKTKVLYSNLYLL